MQLLPISSIIVCIGALCIMQASAVCHPASLGDFDSARCRCGADDTGDWLVYAGESLCGSVKYHDCECTMNGPPVVTTTWEHAGHWEGEG